MTTFFPYDSPPRGIGEFIIGVSPIGSTPFKWSDTVMSQYANSARIMALIDAMAQNLDQTENIDAFYDNIWNVLTAVGYGLDVWGRIVNVDRVLTGTVKYLGFEQAGALSADPFNQSPFYRSGDSLTQNFRLADDAYRQLILAKAAANIWDGSIPGANLILRLLFPGLVAYVTDGQDMTMTYTFGWELTPVQVAIVESSGVLPRPAGVKTSVVQMIY